MDSALSLPSGGQAWLTRRACFTIQGRDRGREDKNTHKSLRNSALVRARASNRIVHKHDLTRPHHIPRPPARTHSTGNAGRLHLARDAGGLASRHGATACTMRREEAIGTDRRSAIRKTIATVGGLALVIPSVALADLPQVISYRSVCVHRTHA